MKVIKQRPYVSAAVIILVLTVVSVGIWYTTTQMDTDDTAVISSASSSLSEPTISSGVTGYSGPYNQARVTPNIDCVVSYPNTWGPCNDSTNTKSMTGTVITPQSGTGSPCVPLTRTAPCDKDCVVRYPNTWGPCNDSTNTKSMTGTVITPQSGTGSPCGPLTRTAPCDKDCVVTYGPWEECNEFTNTKNMNGTVTTPQSGTGAGCGPLTRTAPCDKDCVVTYGDWGPCNTSSGLKSRSGTVTTLQSGTGSSCGPLSMTESCPVDCVVNYPSTWSSCSSSGVQTMTGNVVIPQMNGGAPCPPLTISKSCVPRPPEYIGCYHDNTNPRPLRDYQERKTVAECNDIAKTANSPYFGMQYWQSDSQNDLPGRRAECWYQKDSTLVSATRHGEVSPGSYNYCTRGADGLILGAEYSNAIYKTF